MREATRNRRNYCWNEIDAEKTLGARTCSNPCCVRPAHVIPAIEMEWWDISYRTGKKLTHQEIYEKIVSELCH
jgi:hypothetical protein